MTTEKTELTQAAVQFETLASGFQSIVERSPDAIFVQHDGRMVFVNEAGVRLLRAESAERLLGRSLLDFVEPEYRAVILKRVERLRQGLANPLLQQELVALDGRVITVEAVSAPVLFGGGPAMAVMMRDVTERVAVEERLRALEERFNLISRATKDAMWDWDLLQGTVWWGHSPNEFFGDDRDTEGQKTFEWWAEHVHDDDRARILKGLDLAIRSSEHFWSDSYLFGQRDRGYIRIVSRAYIVRDDTGRAVRMIGAMTDISELSKAQEERASLTKLLEQANRIAGLGRLAATVAHEFNNVLMAIQPYAEVMQRRSADPAVVGQSARSIMDAVQRGKRITEDILRFARPAEPILSPLRVDEWLNRFVQDVRAMNMPKVEVVLECSANGTQVLGDSRQLEQLLWNLVVNARDAMPDGGRLTLGSGWCGGCECPCELLSREQREPFACIRLSDTGQGIPEDLMSKIFEPLYTTKRNGTGLGLAVAHQIANRHGGYIFAQSKVGQGTTFYLLLKRIVPAQP